MPPVQRHPVDEYLHLAGIESATCLALLTGGEYVPAPRDGNCLYFTIAFLVYSDFISRPALLAELVGMFDQASISSVVYEPYLESIQECLEINKTGYEMDEADWMLFIGLFRLAVSSYLKINKKEYQEFITEDIETYVKHNVDPMGRRAGELEITVLCKVLGIRIEVIQVQNDCCTMIEYGEYGNKYAILHTPDHFEPLYRPELIRE